MYLRLLGPPEAEIATGVVRFLPERRFQLLAYLAARGGWVSRDEVATLFYADRANDAARSNLRKVLLQVRALDWLGDSFEADRHALRWLVASDLDDFRKAAAQSEHDRVLALHRGPPLAGLEAADSAAFATWLDDERRRVHAAWRTSLLSRAQDATHEQALASAGRLLADDPLDEDAEVLSLAALLALGRNTEAERRYREYERHLARELGVAPSSRIRALGEGVGRGAQRPGSTGAAASAGDFIGRERELEELTVLLANPDCRLLTVTGPGGIGKSRLVKEAIRGLAGRYRDGVTWVPLDDLTETAQVAARIAASLAVAVPPNGEPLEVAIRHLKDRDQLLVLDNSEHLRRLDGVVARLLAGAPRLHLLSTSRARIGIAGEWLLPLAGLALADDSADAESALDADAARLFVLSAHAVEPRFEAAKHAAAIGRLVRVVAGMPLAILLAAGWVRLLPVSELAAAVTTSLDVLERPEDGEERPEHRSVRATFDQSWRMLAAQEQRALAALSVFGGTFSREAAREVAAAPLPLLAALVDKSLVQVGSDGRFSLHPLILQFAAEKLAQAPDEATARRDRHADAVARLMKPYEHFDTVDQPAALRTFGIELANLLAAWSWSIERGKFDVLKVCASGLSNHFQAHGPVATGAALFARAEAAVESAEVPNAGALFATAIERAALSYWLADYAQVEVAARRALKAARQTRDAFGIRTSLNTLGLSLLRQGRPAPAHRFIDEALKRARADRVAHEFFAYAGNLVGVKQDLGDADGAHRLALEAFEGHRANNHVVGQTSMCNELGLIEHRRGQLELASEWFERGLRLSESASQTLRSIQFLTHLGTVHLDRGDRAAARRCCEQSLAMALGKGVRSLEPTCRRTLAAIELAEGRYGEARDQLVAATELARQIGTDLIVIPLLRDCALYFEARGNLPLALELVAVAEANRTSRAALLPRFHAQLERLRGDLDSAPKSAVSSLVAGLDRAAIGLQPPA